MVATFLSFEWKSARRASIWQKNLTLNLLIGFFLLLGLLYLLLLGFFITPIIQQLFPNEDPVTVFNGFLIYYFLSDLFIRFMMQSLPSITLESFLHLPIRKSTIIHYMVGRTLLNFFNLVPLFIFLPVLFTLIVPHEGIPYAIRWIITMLLMVLGNNFLSTWIKRLFGTKPLIVLLLALLIGVAVALDKTGMISMTGVSSLLVEELLGQPVLIVLPAGWCLVAYTIHYQFLRSHLFPDEVQVRRDREIHASAGNQFLRSFGTSGTIIMLEMKLYWRHKRTRTIIYMLPLFLGYGLFFYFQPATANQDFMLFFVGVFMTGGMMLNYTNYAFGYESNYFDALLTKNIDFRQYLSVKFLIAIGISTICWILTIPYLLFSWHILFVNTAMFFYNIGILSYILLYFATFNKKRMDLSKSATFNYQGIGASNWLAVIPAFLLPILIQIPFKRMEIPDAGLIVVTLLGIVGLVLNRQILSYIYQSFENRKYIMASSFRELS